MVNAEDVKLAATPKDVARYFLGEPNSERGGKLWYCSPFRREEHPSFEVTDIGMYDFGDSEFYDVIKFIEKLRNVSFKESIEILATTFGVPNREYEDKAMFEWYKKQREEEKEYHDKLHEFYLTVWDEVDKEYHENKEYLEALNGRLGLDSFADCLHRKAEIWGMEEYLALGINSWQDEEKLYQSALKGEIPKWLMNRIKDTSMWLDLNIKQPQKREF